MFKKFHTLKSALAARIAAQALGAKSEPVVQAVGISMKQALLYCGVPLSVIWLGLWAANDKWSSRLNFRWMAHLGPYLLPRAVRDPQLEGALSLLATEPLLLSSERSLALGRIEAISNRRVALKHSISRLGFRVFTPVLADLAAAPVLGQKKTLEHFEATVRIAWDCLSAAPADVRDVSPEVLEGIVTNNADFWKCDPWGDEVRATLLLLLLENRRNAAMARNIPALVEYLRDDGSLVKYNSVYPYRQKLYGSETHDIKLKCLRLIGADEEIGEKLDRLSPAIVNKLTARSIELLVASSVVYSILRTFAQSSSLSSINLLGFASRLRSTVAGGLIFEGLYRLEENLINAEAYYSNDSLMLSGSLSMLGFHILAGAYILRYGLWLAGPFIAMRVFRDPNTDPFRQS